MTLILNLIFRRVAVTKILNFGLKIKGGGKGGGKEGGTCEVLRPCHPLPKEKLKRALGTRLPAQ